MRRFFLLSIVSLAWLFLGAGLVPGKADEFEGAASLLKKLFNLGGDPDANAGTNTYVQLSKDLAQFSSQSAGLPPKEAAKEWLAFFDRAVAMRKDPALMGMSSALIQRIIQVIPGPGSCPDLQEMVEARLPDQQPDAWSHALLLLIVHTLNNAEDKQWADLALLETASADPSNRGTRTDATSAVLLLGSKLSSVSGRPEDAAQFWDRFLGVLEKVPNDPPVEGDTEVAFEIPDLVTLLGSTRAEPLLERALLLPHTKFAQIDGKATQQLARKIALGNVDKLAYAPWYLTESLDAADLYQALIKKFPADEDSNLSKVYYVLALVVQGKPDDAVSATADLDDASMERASIQAADAGYGQQVYDFLHALLQAHPEDDCWKTYITLAAQTSHAAEALQFVQDSLVRKDLTDPARARIQSVLYRALLAVDKVDEGIAELRSLIHNAKSASGASPGKGLRTRYVMQGRVFHFDSNGENGRSQIVEWNIELARLGHVLKRASLETEGLEGAKAEPAGEELISYLMETGRNSDAEKLLISAIAAEAAKEKGNPEEYRYYGIYSPNQQNLVKLATVYYNAGRWADILLLLQKAPGWGAVDLVTVAGQKAYSERYTPPSLGLMAARALVETGQVDQALPILDYVLQVDAGDDGAYELLLKIGKGDLVAKLDTLYRQDQFQNRPLIWKATVLLKQGKIAEAEAACKAAIAVDPSDGETGKGNRMRVYSVMADICEAKKDTTQAEFFHKVVRAIRLSENADDFFDAGLLAQAVGMYGQALDLFSDAYCIQSRIARQLAELGRMDEAAVHYRKAFELMPVSFGRMESHCFGCERAFQGKTAVSIAEKTFTDMLAKDPTKPQISYLLGYLDMEEEKFPEALTHFQKATELDPDYINAWKQISVIGNDYQLSPDLRDEAIFNVMRLDPAGRHITPSTVNVRQLTQLWEVEVACGKAVPPPPAKLFSLDAAQQASDKVGMGKSSRFGFNAITSELLDSQMSAQMGLPAKGEAAARQALLENGVLSTALQSFR
jgi:tetratricopeptide (TPR) repeat protein